MDFFVKYLFCGSMFAELSYVHALVRIILSTGVSHCQLRQDGTQLYSIRIYVQEKALAN